MDIITPSFIIYACFIVGGLAFAINKISYRLCSSLVGVFGFLVFLFQFFLSSIDGLSLTFALMCSFVGSMVLIYSSAYFKNEQSMFGQFCLFTLIFLGSMLGLLYAQDLIQLFIYWELTSLSSFLLIGLKHKNKEARESARMALLVTAAGGLCLLAGIVLIGEQAQSYELSALSNNKPSNASVILVLLGAFTKAAQFPFHFWLPAAMKAPTPASAFLHSAAMVKAGPYLVARLGPIFSNVSLWSDTLIVVGAISGFIGAWMSIVNKDLKAILAGLTVLALGILFILLGVGTPKALEAFVLFLLAHSLYKSCLFMCAGVVDKKIGTRNIFKIQGVGRLYPFLGLIFVLGGLSLGGVFPLLGFVAKESLLEALKDHYIFIPMILILVGLGVGALRSIVPLFFKKKGSREKKKIEFALLLPPFTCALVGLLIGIQPGWINPLVSGPLKSMGITSNGNLYLWHGVNEAFLISLGIIGLSIVCFFIFGSKRFELNKSMSERAYKQVWRLIHIIAGRTTAFWNKSGASLYIYIFFGFALLLVGGVFVTRWSFELPKFVDNANYYEWCASLVVVLGAGLAVRASSIFVGVIGMAISGYGISLLFILYSSPDLALTQFLVETMTVILVCFIFIKFPKNIPKRSHSKILFNSIVSIGVGGLAVGIIWRVLAYPFNSSAAEFFKENAFILAHGKNITNVAIVDFRAFDTLGEATVLFLAGIGVGSLFRLMPGFKKKEIE